MTIRRGDVFRHELAGGGGWGDPLERDPDAVLADVRNELITARVRRARHYGVAIDRAAWTVDAGGDRARCAPSMRAARGPGPLPTGRASSRAVRRRRSSSS